MCPSMDAYLRLCSLEADLDKICFYEHYLLESLLRKAGRMLGRQDQKGSRPSKAVTSSKVWRHRWLSLAGGPGDKTGHALEVPIRADELVSYSSILWVLVKCPFWGDMNSQALLSLLMGLSRKNFCLGCWRYCCSRPCKVLGFYIHNEWVDNFHFAS